MRNFSSSSSTILLSSYNSTLRMDPTVSTQNRQCSNWSTRTEWQSLQQKQKVESYRNRRSKQKTSRNLDSELRLFNDARMQTAGRHNGPRGTVMWQQATPSNTIQRTLALSLFKYSLHRRVPQSLYLTQRNIPWAHALIWTFTVRWLLYVPHQVQH